MTKTLCKISVEFFPPQTEEGTKKLQSTYKQLSILKPEFFSVTYGAGGATQKRTLEAVLDIQKDGFPVAPHISCIGSTRETIKCLLDRYQANAINHLVALRGDLPSGTADSGEFRYASDLVTFIREQTGNHFVIDVAAYPEYHPQAKTPHNDLKAFKKKIDAGANAAITQFFFNFDAYAHFVDCCSKENITIPIIPGIMPITNFSRLARFADNCGAEIPRWMRAKFESFGDDHESIRSFGLDVITNLCERLLDFGVPSLHFYSMNHAELTLEICRRLQKT